MDRRRPVLGNDKEKKNEENYTPIDRAKEQQTNKKGKTRTHLSPKQGTVSQYDDQTDGRLAQSHIL